MRRALLLLSSIFLPLLLILALNKATGALSAAPVRGVEGGRESAAARTELLSSSREGLEFELHVPGYEVDASGTVLALGLNSATREEGAPALPTYSTLVLLPPEADVSIDVEILDEQVRQGLRVQPAPRLDRTSLDVPDVPEALTDPARLSYVQDAAVYRQDALYPSVNYRISEPLYYRDLRLVRLELFPLRYNPHTMTMEHATAMRVSLSFRGAVWPKIDAGGHSQAIIEDPVASLALNYEQGRNWRAFPSTVESSATKLPVGRDTFKIAINEDGIYEIGYSELQDAGMAVSTVNPRTFEMMYRGQPVAYELVNDNGDTTFDRNEAVRFYAWAFDGSRLEGQFLTENVFWLWAEGTPTNIGVVQSVTDTAKYPVADSFEENITREPERVYAYSSASWPSFPNEPDTWFWATDIVSNSGPITATREITLPAPYAGGLYARVTVELLSRNSGPNHNVTVSLNDAQAYSGDDTWENVQDVNVTTTVPMTAVLDGVNKVHIRYDTEIASGEAHYYLNRITVDYQRRFLAENDRLSFSNSGPGESYNMAGFSSGDALIWDVTDRMQPMVVDGVQVSDGPAPYSYTFGSDLSDRAYIATPTDAVLSPLSIQKYVPPNLEPGSGADWIAISHDNFMSAAELLAQHRSNPFFGDLTTHVVDIADVINQYGYGLPVPAAINAYLAHALVDWQIGPRYVLLVGDGHVNPKQIRCESGGSLCKTWDLSEPNYVLTDLVYWDQIIGINNSDYSFSLLSGDDLIPDVAIGRLAVQTNQEALNIVDKIVDYETSRWIPREWHRNVVFVADDPDLGGDFCVASKEVGDTLPNTYDPLYLCLTEATEEAENQLRGEIHDAVNYPNGATIVNYRGHGAPRNWGGNIINLDDPDIKQPWLNNEPLVILSMDCYDGFFAIPGEENEALSEVFLELQAIGTVAHWSSTGLGWDFQHRILHQSFYDGLFGQSLTAVGDAVNYAKLAYVLSNHHRSQLYSFVLQGDPAMQLMRPDLRFAFLPNLQRPE